MLVDAGGAGLWRLQHPLLCACAPLRAARIASIVVVPIVWRPLALVLIVLAPLLGILLILVIAGLRVGLGSRRWRWGIGSRIVGAIAPIVVGRWWRRWRWWGCVALGVASLVVGRLAITRLWRAVAAHCRGAGIGAGARDVAVFVVAAGSRRVPSRAIARWWWWLLWWWLWWWWLL